MSLTIGDGPPVGGNGIVVSDHLAGADLTVLVPTCPGWNVSQLARHIDGGQRYGRAHRRDAGGAAAERCGAAGPVGPANVDPEQLSASLTEAAAVLRATLTDVGPDAQMWCPVDGAARRSMPVGSPTRPRCTGPTRCSSTSGWRE